MKHARRLVTLAIVLAMLMVCMIPTALAAETPSITINANNDTSNTESLTITYKWYKILSASIDTDPDVNVDGTTTSSGVVAYYVTNQDQANELTETNLFNVVQVSGETKWYVELKDSATTAETIASAFSADAFDLSKFASGEFTKDKDATSATSGTVDAGYYYIESSLGTKVAVQTLSAVTINEKNAYPTISKTYNEVTDKLAGINDVVTYTVSVTIPATVAEKEIKVVDTITSGLTLNTSVTVAGAVADPAYTSANFVENAGVYELTIPAAVVKANAGKTLTFTYTATVNENAKVLVAESNKAKLVYDGYTTVDTVAVETKVLAFTVKKVDGTDKTTELTGAEFSLWTAESAGTQINLIKVSDGVYRVATATEVAVVGFTSAAVETGTATIEGLNDAIYYLQEDVAPTGYNKLENRVAVEVTEATSADGVDINVENNKGSVLPSTGGVGTTIFYILGSVMFLGALVVLVTNKRMRSN